MHVVAFACGGDTEQSKGDSHGATGATTRD